MHSNIIIIIISDESTFRRLPSKKYVNISVASSRLWRHQTLSHLFVWYLHEQILQKAPTQHLRWRLADSSLLAVTRRSLIMHNFKPVFAAECKHVYFCCKRNVTAPSGRLRDCSCWHVHLGFISHLWWEPVLYYYISDYVAWNNHPVDIRSVGMSWTNYFWSSDAFLDAAFLSVVFLLSVLIEVFGDARSRRWHINKLYSEHLKSQLKLIWI